MRLSFILVVAVSSFLVSCDAATQPEQSQLSTTDAAPVTSSRFLRSAQAEEEDEEREEEDSEERMVSLKNIKVPSYLNHPLLAPEKQVVAAAKAAEKATKLSKADDAILTKLKSIHNGLDRFTRWKTQEFTPARVKKILLQTNAKKGGPEWQTYYQYLAAYMRQNHKVT